MSRRRSVSARRMAGADGYRKLLDGVRIVPYRLPSFAGGSGTVYIVEGEKDVEALRGSASSRPATRWAPANGRITSPSTSPGSTW